MPEVQLSAGTIHYEDNDGDGPVLVLTHGLLMDASMWDPVVAELSDDYRIVRPVLPLGAHTQPMRAGADLTMRGIASLLGEFLEVLDLREVTLGMSDWGDRSSSSPKDRPSRCNESHALCCCPARPLTTSHPGSPDASRHSPAGCPVGYALPSLSFAYAACANCPHTLAG
jgi:pimeloyl-ACP methyl ester carboxylesterase